MSALVLAAVFAAAPAAADEDGFSFPTSKGGTHLIGIGGVIGTGAAMVVIVGALLGPQNHDLTPSGAAAAGLFALFLGGGLTGARLLEPTPAAAWGSFWAGTAGAGLGMAIAFNLRPQGPASLEEAMLLMATGYLAAAGLYAALPDAAILSWKEFWATVGPGALAFIGMAIAGIAANLNRYNDFNLATAIVPVTAILVSRVLFSAWQPFDPWVDDLKGPFRAQPIIALGPTGASVGIAASW